MSTTETDPIPAAATQAAPPKSNKPSGKSPATVAWLMLVPAGVLLITFLIIPIILTFVLAFTDARLISPRPARFIAFDNFARLFQDETFWHSLQNTVVFAIVVVPVQSAVALGLAILVNKKMRGTNFFRTIYFLPVVTSIVVVSILWQFMYQPNGLINATLARFGIQGPDWLGNPNTALFAIIVLSIWQACGMHMVIWLSGLQTIPGELYEAADIDGASKWQQFAHVTWPGLRQTAVFILITITIAAFSLFAQVNLMTQGGPLDSTTTLVYMAVRVGYQQQQTGYAAAISLVFFALVLIVTLINRYVTRDKDAR